VFELSYQAIQNPAVQDKVQKPAQPQGPTPAQQKMADQGTTPGKMPPSAPAPESKEDLTSDEEIIAEGVGLSKKQMLEGKKLSDEAKKEGLS